MNLKRMSILVFVMIGAFSPFLLSRALYKPKVFDCFMFFNEFDVLDIRLNELNDKVDKFVLVESTKGFLGDKKPLYFLENKERYSKFLGKIIHVVVDEFPEFKPVGAEDYWEIENFQRNQIMKGLQRCRPNKRDIIIISDLDEIVRSQKIPKIVNLIDKKGNDIVFGDFEVYRFFLNRKQAENIKVTVATSWGILSKYLLSPQAFRNLSGFAKGHAFNGFEVLEMVKKQYPRKKWSFARIDNIGWHFTSLGGYQTYLEKIKNYCHHGVNNEYNRNVDNIRMGIEELALVEIADHFPQYVIANKEILQARGFIDQKDTVFH